jgi:hypothetical protein
VDANGNGTPDGCDEVPVPQPLPGACCFPDATCASAAERRPAPRREESSPERAPTARRRAANAASRAASACCSASSLSRLYAAVAA